MPGFINQDGIQQIDDPLAIARAAFAIMMSNFMLPAQMVEAELVVEGAA